MLAAQKKNPKRDPSVETTSLPDGHVVLTDASGWAYTLTPLAALVWEFCDGTHSIEDILDQLKDVPGTAERNGLAKEVDELLKQLDEEGFFTVDG